MFFILILTRRYVYQLEKKRKGERGRNIDVREKHVSVASYMLPDRESNSHPRYVP